MSEIPAASPSWMRTAIGSRPHLRAEDRVSTPWRARDTTATITAHRSNDGGCDANRVPVQSVEPRAVPGALRPARAQTWSPSRGDPRGRLRPEPLFAGGPRAIARAAGGDRGNRRER